MSTDKLIAELPENPILLEEERERTPRCSHLQIYHQVIIPIFLEDANARLPIRANEADACFDIHSCTEIVVPSSSVRGSLKSLLDYIEAKQQLVPGGKSLESLYDKLPEAGPYVVDCGFRTAIPPGWEATLRSRSGLGFKKGIQIHPGTIDAHFTGRWSVGIYNHSDFDFCIHVGDRIAQVAFRPIPAIQLNEVSDVHTLIPEGARGDKGHGSSGR